VLALALARSSARSAFWSLHSISATQVGRSRALAGPVRGGRNLLRPAFARRASSHFNSSRNCADEFRHFQRVDAVRVGDFLLTSGISWLPGSRSAARFALESRGAGPFRSGAIQIAASYNSGI